MTKPGRNDPCSCGSGKKYKRCCLAKDEEADAHSPSRQRHGGKSATPLPHRYHGCE